MRSLRVLAVLVGAATLALGGTTAANASPPGPGGCSGGPIYGGTYSSFSVTGDCWLAYGAQLVVQGNLTISPGAELDATQYSTSSLTVRGNLTAGKGAQFAMGCSREAHPCSDGGHKAHGQDSVKGNVALDRVFNAAINNAVIGNNLTSTGGGAGPYAPGFVPFSVKDDTIGGNVSVTGLSTVWFGIIRSTIGGNVLVANTRGTDPDSNEILTNRIGGNLACYGNWPRAQYGDAISEPVNGPNVVRGVAAGECAILVAQPR